MTSFQIIVAATPVFLALIALEYQVGVARVRNTYRLNDALASMGLGMLGQLANMFTITLNIGIYVWVFANLAPRPLDAGSPWVWVAALLGYDFCFYWHHRAGHRVGVLWATHVVHHQSERYNLSTALRQPATGWLFGWVFYLPLALLGVPPQVLVIVALVDVLYQFWVHTEQIGRLGWYDRWFVSPSNHRVHHAVNDRYLDRNYGGVLLVWDRLFGTFQEERDDDPPLYGTRVPLRSFDPVTANLQVFSSLWRDARAAASWRDRFAVWLHPPGWRPAAAAARLPQRRFDVGDAVSFDPPLEAPAAGVAVLLYAIALAVAAWLLWHAREYSAASLAGGCLVVVLLLAGVASRCNGRAGPAMAPAGTGDCRPAADPSAAGPSAPAYGGRGTLA